MTDGTTGNNGTLGHIVAWRVPQTVALDALRSALQQAGLSEDLAGDLHPRHVLSRALRDMRQGRVICRFGKSADAVHFQLTREAANGVGVDYAREAVVTLDLRTGVVSADDYAVQDRARALVAEHAAKRLTGDLTRLVQTVYESARADLIPIREQGGAYFVPAAHSALVDQSRVFLAAIGGRLNSFAVRLGCADTAQSVAESMAEYMAALIAEFRESCASVCADSRADVVVRRQERIADLRQRLECYRGLLAGSAEAIGEAIATAEGDLLAALMRAPASDTASAPAAQMGMGF